MSLNKTIKRELKVAFSKKTQSVRFRIVKYAMLAVLIYFLWGTGWLWPVLVGLFIISFCIHLFYRYKTHGWTKSFGGWKHH